MGIEIKEDDINLLRQQFRLALLDVLYDQKIEDAKQYFTFWLQSRKILEEELNLFLSDELKTKLCALFEPKPK